MAKKPAKPKKATRHARPQPLPRQPVGHGTPAGAGGGPARRPVPARKAPKAAKAGKPRKWSPDADVALCSARAVATALELLSGPVLSDADVLALYWTTASDPDEGQTLSAAFRAARGLVGQTGGRNPTGARGFRLLAEPGPYRALALSYPGLPDFSVIEMANLLVRAEAGATPVHEVGGREPAPSVAIFGLDIPGGEPHAVVVDIDGTWWSWGEPCDPAFFAGAIIDEAWAVTL